MIIIGGDLSLTSPGLARVDTDARTFTAAAYVPPKHLGTGHARDEWILEQVRDLALGAGIAVLEEPPYHIKGTAVHALAGLRRLVTHELWKMGVPYAEVNVQHLKLYATGNSKADKDDVMRRTGQLFTEEQFSGNNDAADALWLALMGAEHVGQPLVEVSATRRGALAKVTWPESTR
jgi:hypothetical protein